MPPRPSVRLAAAGCLALLALAAPARAQGGGKGFLFAAPQGGVSLRGGFFGASARSDLFAFVTDTLTLRRGDFAGPGVLAELTVALPGTRLEAVLGGGYAATRASSEFRDWVDEDDRPIAQTTEFRRAPVTLGLKAYLAPRGRAIGRFAWVPARVAPYVGVGAGATWYEFRQKGEFVDFETNAIFGETYESTGWGATGYAGGGVDVSLSPRVALTADARWAAARARVSGSFEGYVVDLGGPSTTVGLTYRF